MNEQKQKLDLAWGRLNMEVANARLTSYERERIIESARALHQLAQGLIAEAMLKEQMSKKE